MTFWGERNSWVLVDGKEGKEKWDGFYSYSPGNAILRSSDDVLCSVLICDLTRRSTVFADMFSVPLPSSAEPIAMPLKHAALRMTLDMIRARFPICYDDDLAFDVWDFSLLFDIEGIKESLLRSFAHSVFNPQRSWATLREACRRRNIEAARALLAQYNPEPRWLTDPQIFWPNLRKLSPPWRRALVHILFDGKDYESVMEEEPVDIPALSCMSKEHYFKKQEPWAAKFDPLDPSFQDPVWVDGEVKRDKVLLSSKEPINRSRSLPKVLIAEKSPKRVTAQGKTETPRGSSKKRKIDV